MRKNNESIDREIYPYDIQRFHNNLTSLYYVLIDT